jgi:hypothetical protein
LQIYTLKAISLLNTIHTYFLRKAGKRKVFAAVLLLYAYFRFVVCQLGLVLECDRILIPIITKIESRIRIRAALTGWSMVIAFKKKKVSHGSLVLFSVVNPHQIERQDPDPHRSERLDPDPHQFAKTNCMEYEPI